MCVNPKKVIAYRARNCPAAGRRAPPSRRRCPIFKSPSRNMWMRPKKWVSERGENAGEFSMSITSSLRIPFLRTRQHRDTKMQEICGINYRTAVAAFEDAGFWILREGVHVVMTDGQHILTIPCEDPVN